MSEFNEVINKYNKLCVDYDSDIDGEDREFCPLYHVNKGCEGIHSCIDFVLKHPQEAENIIMNEM